MHHLSEISKSLPNMLTCSNIVLAFVSVLLVIEATATAGPADTYFFVASWLIVIAMVNDGLDGALARKIGVSGNLGMQLDSLADLVAFGFAPAVLLYGRFLRDLPVLFAAIPAFFAFAAAFRLARFNVTTDLVKKPYFQGMPSTGAGGLIAVFVLFTGFLQRFELSSGHTPTLSIIAAVIGLASAVLMISKVPFPSFYRFMLRIRNRPLQTTFLIVLLLLTFEFPGPVLLGIGLSYTFESLGKWLFKAITAEHSTDDDLEEDDEDDLLTDEEPITAFDGRN